MSSCIECGDEVSQGRAELGYKVCMVCGEDRAKRYRHTIVPMPKSNYIVVTDLNLLLNLNNSHKGGSK
jgi:hypothetical protein